MKPIFTQEQACNILNGNYIRLNADKECTISKAMFAEAVENMEIPADVSNGNDSIAAVLNKAARTEEAISKNILYSGLKANSTNTTWVPFNGYSYTNLNDNKTPNLDSLNDILEKLDSSIFSGVSGNTTTYTLTSDEAVTTLHKTFIETLKTISDQKDLVYNNIFSKTNANDEDQESLGIKAYTYFRGGSAIVRATIDPEKNGKLYQDIKGDVPNIVNAYSTPFRKAVTAFQSITNKLNREAVAPTQQQADQLKYAAEKLASAIACYVTYYLAKANVVYAAKADAIAELLNAKDAYAVADQVNTEKPEPMDKDSIFESFDFDDEFGIGMMDGDDQEPIYALESSAIECEYEYLTKELLLQEAADKFYATYFDDPKLIYKEDMQQMAQQAADKLKQAYNDKGNLATRFRKIWAQFEQFLQNIFAKFKTSMETRVKDMQAYISQNEDAIRTNGQNSNAIATFGDYKQGLKNIQNVVLPDINQLVANAEKGTIASVEDIQTQVKGFSRPFTPGGDNNFTEFCKIQFYGTMNGKIDHPVKNIVGDAIEFCKDFKGYSDLVDKQTKDVSAVEKIISDKLDKLTQTDKQQAQQQPQQQQLPPGQPQQQTQNAQPQQQTQPQQQPAQQPQQTSQHNSVTYEDIKNYIQSYLEADQKDDGPGMSIKTPDGKSVSSGEGNATSDPEKKAANAISTLAINYQNVMRSVHTAKITAYERIYVDYSKLLKSLGNGVEQPVQQNGTQPQGQQQPQQNNQQQG